MSDPNLVTTYNLHGQDYLVKMSVINNYLELLISDKQTGEEWQCSYDNIYIENLTHKTGNFKQFSIFITMLKSGLLKTSSSITLDLLTYEDLESLRIRRLKSGSNTKSISSNKNNKRYLILTYTVEFDRIHYPLPLEYCGPPDPIVLQATIRKLESELAEARLQANASTSRQDSRQIARLQSKVDELYSENLEQQEEIKHLRQITNSKSAHNLQHLQRAIHNLEKSVISERKSHHQLVEKLRKEKVILFKEVEKLKSSEKALKLKLQQAKNENMCLRTTCRKSDETVKTMFRRQSPRIPRATTAPVDIIRPRSLSPKVTKSEGWEKKSVKSDIRRFDSPVKVRSRTSSQESLKLSDLEEMAYDTEKEKRHTPNLRRTRRKGQRTHSRASSASSNESTLSARSKKSDSASLHLMLKTSELEFKSLEERIEGLHSLLKTTF